MDFTGLERPLKQGQEGEFFPQVRILTAVASFTPLGAAAGIANLPKTVLQSGLACDGHVS